MSYDYADGSDSISGHHTNCNILMIPHSICGQIHKSIYGSRRTAEKNSYWHRFYGKGWKMQSDDNNGLYRRAQQPARGGGLLI